MDGYELGLSLMAALNRAGTCDLEELKAQIDEDVSDDDLRRELGVLEEAGAVESFVDDGVTFWVDARRDEGADHRDLRVRGRSVRRRRG